MMTSAHEPTEGKTWRIGEEGPLDIAVLFVDLISSSDFASVLGLREYAEFVGSFENLCSIQCRYFFDEVHRGEYRWGRDYEFHTAGEELVVFMHSGNATNDVYQLICLAIAIKCGWLGTDLNAQRIANGVASAELAAGINFGRVWARSSDAGFEKCGFAINVAKRIESLSREGERFRVFVNDTAFKQVNLRVRNLIFGPRRVLPMNEGIVPIGVYEVIESFVDVSKRLAPEIAATFLRASRQALESNTLDLWIHSCLQVWAEAECGNVSDEMLERACRVLRIDPWNAVALYYSAQGMQERGDFETAELSLSDLVRHCPNLADGWLELGRLRKRRGHIQEARTAILQARRHGVADSEEELPE